jgi:uncharacterized protein
MDELTAPLGRSPAPRRLFSVPRAIGLALAASLLGVGLWVVLAQHPFRGKPMAVSRAPQQQVEAKAPMAPPRAASDPTGAIREPVDSGTPRTITIIDGMSGKRQEVVVGSPDPAPRVAPGQRSP